MKNQDDQKAILENLADVQVILHFCSMIKLNFNMFKIVVTIINFRGESILTLL